MRVDIREEKRALRTKFKLVRMEMPPQERRDADEKILRRLCNLWSFRENELLWVYVSGDPEVDTRALIDYALQNGKTVAVPRCVPGTRNMEFYRIRSMDELLPGAYGILEPQPLPENLVTDFENGLCIVPALAVDEQGYRLGFGKGYYDRFLAGFHGSSLSLCYENSITKAVPRGKYDNRIPLVVTEKRVLRPKTDGISISSISEWRNE